MAEQPQPEKMTVEQLVSEVRRLREQESARAAAEKELLRHRQEIQDQAARLAEAQSLLEKLQEDCQRMGMVEELRLNAEQLELAQSAGDVGSWGVDLLSHELRWSDKHFQLLGLEPHSVRPTYELWKERLHPDDRQSAAISGLCREDINEVAVEYRILRPDGQVRWLASRGKVLRDAAGKRIRMIGVTIDITESKEAHRRLEDLNEALLQRTREAEQRNAQLRSLAAQLTQAENRERRRLAMLLHDHLQQLLIASRMKVGLARQQVSSQQTESLLAQTAELVDEAIVASRSLSVELNPPMLHDSGLTAALEWLARQMEDKHGLKVELRIEDEPEDEDIRVFLFQCVRELLLNTVKHAETAGARVRVQRRDSQHVAVTVTDSGRGFDLERFRHQKSSSDAFGLRGIHERLELLGGQFEIRSAPGQGTKLTLIAPSRKPQAVSENWRLNAVATS